MKVIQIYKDYYPPVKGGIEGHINLLSRGLYESGTDVRVLVSNKGSTLKTEILNSIKITKVPELGRIASAPINPTLHKWMNQLGRNADILHFHLPNPTAVLAYLFSKGLKGKVVATYHSDIVRQKWLGKMFSPFLHLFLKKTDTILATSPNYIESSKILTAYRDKCEIVPLGINFGRFKEQKTDARRIHALRKKYGNAILLFIGRFRYYKGLHVLIDAMSRIDAKLLLIGTGPLEQQLRRQVDSSNMHHKVHFLGELSDDEVNIYLKLCDIFVLPSVYRSEAFGIVQLEAMACGKPVVSCELGTGVSFVNQHQKTGLVVHPGNPTELASAINTLLADPSLRTAMGKAGKRRVGMHFSSDLMIRKTLDVYGRSFVV